MTLFKVMQYHDGFFFHYVDINENVLQWLCMFFISLAKLMFYNFQNLCSIIFKAVQRHMEALPLFGL